jgi:hypothetical protein
MHINPTVLILFLLAISSIIFSAFLLWKEIGELNRKLPDTEQIPYFWMYTGKRMRIKHEYKRLYPNGRIDLAVFAFEFTGFILLILSAVAAGFFK